MQFGIRVFVFLALCAGGIAEAANRTVCASGCQYTNVQAAIDAAVPGDTILLRAGETFVGHYTLRNKNTSSTQFITIRSDAADSSFPAAGVRLIPPGKPGANTARGALPRLIGVGGNGRSTPIFSTAHGAHHYRLQFLDIDGVANDGYQTLVRFGSGSEQTSLSQVAHSLVVDRVWLHGHPAKGMKRGIYLNSRSTDILNSYFEDFFSFSDSQAISGTNGPGPYRIINNHLEAAGENVMFGGDDPKIANLVPSDIEIRGNYLPKDLGWRNPILAAPGRPSAAASSATGSLAGGTHYFKIVAMISAGGGWGYSAPSAERSVVVSGRRSATLSWPAVANATKYRIYRGTSSNGQRVYLETSGTQTSFTYTGAGEKSGVPATSGTRWTVKNLLELKNAQRVTIDSNVFENNWLASQQGNSILFSVRNQSGKAPWSVVRDVTFTNNIVRHVSAGVAILGRDYLHPSQQTRNITIRNNVFEDLDNAFGNSGRFMSISEGPANVVVDHNTIDHEGSLVEVMAGAVSGFVFTNNMTRHNTYGIKGQGYGTGTATLKAFFPGAVVKGNVLAGGSAAAYPAGNFFPPASGFLTHFVSASGSNWSLTSASAFNHRATDGKDIGANFAPILSARTSAVAGRAGATSSTTVISTSLSTSTAPETSTPPPTSTPLAPSTPASPNRPPVANAGGAYSGTAGTALTVNGSGSTDAEAPLVRYDWHFGEDIVLRAADVPAANIKGRWRKVDVSGASGGVALENPNANEAKKATALASPANYVDITFEAASGVPYSVWLRMKAAGDASSNDSVHVQFDGAVNASGSAIHRIGTTNSMVVVLENCDNAGTLGWGWNDGGWCVTGAPVYFKSAGRQTIRIQQREDGVLFDQIVISAAAYAGRSPGLLKSDTTLVPTSLGADTGITANHMYRRGGTYPIRIWVTDSAGQETTSATTATIRTP